VLREKYCWLVADKPSVHGVIFYLWFVSDRSVQVLRAIPVAGGGAA
jgi:hypothetical protein